LDYIDNNSYINKHGKFKNKLITYVVNEKFGRLGTFADFVNVIESIENLKLANDIKISFRRVILKCCMPKGLSIEGYLAVSKYFDNRVARWKFLLAMLVSFGEDVFFSLKSIEYMGVATREDLVLCVKVAKGFAKSNIVAKTRILADINEYENENDIPTNFSRVIRKNAVEEVRFVELFSLDKRLSTRKQKFVDKIMAKCLVLASTFGISTGKTKLGEKELTKL